MTVYLLRDPIAESLNKDRLSRIMLGNCFSAAD